MRGKPARTADGERCLALVKFGEMSVRLAQPRRRSRPGGADGLCGLHRSMAARAGLRVESRDGGFCVWCAQPGRRYVRVGERVEITLCGACGAALKKALA